MPEDQAAPQAGMPDCFSDEQINQLVEYYQGELDKSVTYLENISSLTESYYEAPEKRLPKEEVERMKLEIEEIKENIQKMKQDFLQNIVGITQKVKCSVNKPESPGPVA